MPLVLYNTLGRRKEKFTPLSPERVGLYVCGPTVYDLAHIGNARPVVVFDLLYRLLRRRYRGVKYVRNITDVDDKIIDAARERGEPIEALTRRTTEAFHRDMAALGALPPDVEPRATQHIAAMIAMIERLVAGGHAYPAEGHVLFGVASDPDYGKLSGRTLDEMIAGARVEVAPYKRDPADFVLWKPSANDQPGWASPWGRGRPGWHIECSAMSEAHLGETFDIHGGGLDLIFPHHENEIAQSECAHGKPFVRFWLHNGYVLVEGEKMAKSVGNTLTVRQLLEEGIQGEVLRLMLLATHYRQPLDFTRQTLAQAKARLDRWYRAFMRPYGAGTYATAALGGIAPDGGERRGEALYVNAAFEAALDDDLNTPLALSVMDELATRSLNEPEPSAKAAFTAELAACGMTIGLLGQDPEAWFKGEGAADKVAEIERLIERRRAARASRDFAEADRIRDGLAARGILLEDTAKGTSWRRAG